MNQQTCPSCGALTTDGLLCTRETNALMQNLKALPELLRELQTTLTRQNNSGTGNGGKGAERPLPFDNNASEVGDIVRNTLSTWVRELSMGDDKDLADNPRAWAHWLLLRIERIRGHAAAPEIADEIDHCVRSIRRAIDNRAERVYLGPCQNVVDGKPCQSDELTRDGIVSKATQLYAPANAEAYDCPKCKTPVNVAERRAELLGLVADQAATVGTCAKVLALFGLEVKASTIQNWSKPRISRDGTTYPPRLWSTGVNDEGARVYRVGDVETLIHEAVEAKVAKRWKTA